MLLPGDPSVGLGPAPLDPAHVHAWPIDAALAAGESPARAAARFEETLRTELAADASGRPVFAAVLVGIGSDGHVLSVFPASAAFDAPGWATWAPAPTHIEPHLDRVTLTPAALDATPGLVVAAFGASKAGIVAELLGPRHGDREIATSAHCRRCVPGAAAPPGSSTPPRPPASQRTIRAFAGSLPLPGTASSAGAIARRRAAATARYDARRVDTVPNHPACARIRDDDHQADGLDLVDCRRDGRSLAAAAVAHRRRPPLLTRPRGRSRRGDRARPRGRRERPPHVPGLPDRRPRRPRDVRLGRQPAVDRHVGSRGPTDSRPRPVRRDVGPARPAADGQADGRAAHGRVGLGRHAESSTGRPPRSRHAP